MGKRVRASAIIKYDGKIILIKREKGYDENKRTYYVIPGGGVEESEDLIEATVREIDEELGITIDFSGECFHLETEEKDEYFYVASYKSGTLGTGTGPEFTEGDYDRYGSYEVVLKTKEEIETLNLLPSEAKEYILKNFA